MVRPILSVIVVLLAAHAAIADVRPPFEKGEKFANIRNEVVLGPDVTGYVFVQATESGPNSIYNKLDLTTETAKELDHTHVTVYLIAVPQDIAKEFKTEDELFEALRAKSVKGTHRIKFVNEQIVVSDKVEGDLFARTHIITAIDAKDGIKTKIEKDYELSADKLLKEIRSEQPLSQSGNVNFITAGIAGMAAFAAIAIGGFWLVGRSRRKA